MDNLALQCIPVGGGPYVTHNLESTLNILRTRLKKKWKWSSWKTAMEVARLVNGKNDCR